eukprot:CAMPEP_0183736350 /NCGR_PEP_ID=MMETSP0737-20130205/49045_1 /TAXON_ID=385413 /ORGANISM="Thalassiosira miniscula, Strain CCMP1093" /LENGTH=321 /DNA_ID=CAMNT_0025970319 /DNA_START=125 /DNA_END=1087 /DNA_ORIENTATION=+
MPKQRERNAIQSLDRVIPHEQSQRYAIRLAFDGTTYQGFQSQPYKNTIQDQIEHRLEGLLKRQVRITAWGRTDSGVHAKGAVVTVDLSLDEVAKLSKRVPKSSTSAAEEDTDQMKAAKFLSTVRFPCNSGDTIQPLTREGSITSIAVVPVPLDFDARYSALWKRYVYYISAGGANNLPFAWSRFSWQIKQPLDFTAMVDAAEVLAGQEHNFEWLCVMQQGELRDPRRTVQLSVEIVPMKNSTDNIPYFLQQNGTACIYKITGTCDFFLYKMMRRIVGVLVAIGRHDADLHALKRCVHAYDNNDESNQTEMQVPIKLLQTAP